MTFSIPRACYSLGGGTVLTSDIVPCPISKRCGTAWAHVPPSTRLMAAQRWLKCFTLWTDEQLARVRDRIRLDWRGLSKGSGQD